MSHKKKDWFAEAVRFYRSEHACSQKALARTVDQKVRSEHDLGRGFSVRTLQSVETGSHGPTIVLLELLEVLGGRIVFDGPQMPPKPDDLAALELRVSEIELRLYTPPKRVS